MELALSLTEGYKINFYVVHNRHEPRKLLVSFMAPTYIVQLLTL